MYALTLLTLLELTDTGKIIHTLQSLLKYEPASERSVTLYCTGSLLISNHVFERRRSTRNEPFAILRRDLDQIFWQIVYKRVKTLSSTYLVASRNINIEKDSLPVDVRRSEKSLLKLPIG